MNNIATTRIITSYNKARNEQLALCEQLENIADSLPNQVDDRTCINTAKMIIPLINRAHKMEQEILFPLLEDNQKCLANLSATLERIKREHMKDEFLAEEISELLLSYGRGKPTLDAEATGYILRGFFENLRRHIDFVHELLEPKLNKHYSNS